MHFASHAEVDESILAPSKYYRNNFFNTQNPLDVMVEYGVRNLIY
jgi:UDP-glucose 4-epimerase